MNEVLRLILDGRIGATFTNLAGTFTLPDDVILLDVDDYSYDSCYVDAFVEAFGHTLPVEMPSLPCEIYDALAACDSDGTLGWKRYFDEWKSEGRIK